MNPLFRIDFSISDSLKIVRKSVLIYETIILDSDINFLNGRLRRLAHVVVYAVLTVLLAITLKLGGYSLWLTAGTIVWGWADEATKPLVQGRHFSWLDVGRNVLGIALGMVIVIFIF